MGKLVNLLAGDFNTMDERLLLATMAFGLPFLLFGVAVVLVIRLGWFGLICVFTPIVFTVIPVIVGRVNGRILTKLNVHKDERIKTTGEAIEGIRFVKLYAWELAFSRIIGKLRDLEVSHYVRISVGQSVSRSLASFVSIGGVFVCFVAMYYSNVRFDSSMIFSTMEIMLFRIHFKTLIESTSRDHCLGSSNIYGGGIFKNNCDCSSESYKEIRVVETGSFVSKVGCRLLNHGDEHFRLKIFCDCENDCEVPENQRFLSSSV